MAAELSLELETAKTIARMAASVCQAIQAEMVTGVDKAGQGPVTIADYASQAVISSRCSPKSSGCWVSISSKMRSAR